MSSLAPFSLPTEAELKSYKVMAEITAANPHWRKLGGAGSPEGTIATIFSIILLARELNMPPILFISGGVNNINGKFELSARLMNMIIRRYGHKMKIKISNNEVCTIWGQRKDTLEEAEATFTIEEAARAGLIKDGGGWKKCPSDMLFARAISRLARRLYPDCIGGCYVEGELQETILSQPIEKVDLPSLDEFKIEETLTLNLPSDVDPEMVEKFFEESASQNNCTIESLKKRAQVNMDAFLAFYKNWLDKHSSVDIAV